MQLPRFAFELRRSAARYHDRLGNEEESPSVLKFVVVPPNVAHLLLEAARGDEAIIDTVDDIEHMEPVVR